jgi:alkylation response protein AidB-like acyl-CoA dehydrogenase
MLSVLEKGRVGIGSLAVGIAQAGLEASIGYARPDQHALPTTAGPSSVSSGCSDAIRT